MSNRTMINSLFEELILNNQSNLTLPTVAISSSLELITPERAKALLASQHTNRNLKQKFVDYLASEILNGNWEATNQGIGLDDAGLLVDGQHRLAAIVKADQSVWTLVVRGVSRSVALRAVDQGVARSRAALFSMRGEANSKAKAAICRVLALLVVPDMKYGSASSPTKDQEILNLYRTEIEEVIQVSSKELSANFAGVAVLLLAKFPVKGREFLDGVVSGVGLEADDPRYVMREYLFKNRNRSSSLDRTTITAKTIMMAQHFLTGQTCKTKSPRINSARYVEFCSLLGLEVNKSLFNFCGGGLLPTGTQIVENE